MSNFARLLFIALFLIFSLSAQTCDEDVDLSGDDGSSAEDDDSGEDDDDDDDGSTDPDDNDQDGLSNDVEELFSLEINSSDTDQDGISDGLEFVGFNGDPANLNVSPLSAANSIFLDVVQIDSIDSDQDGLGRIFEENQGLDDDDRDFDNDGYDDSLELVAGSDPRDFDSRPERAQDPIDDGVARQLNDPVDSDNDGLSDSFENSLTSASELDSDSDDDGFSDGIEFLMGSSPVDGLSIPNF